MVKGTDTLEVYQGLIVPLWNWNWQPHTMRSPLKGFNRTFMELKWVWRWTILSWKNGLIVPLWNWNSKEEVMTIESNTRFNRTFMELKSGTQQYCHKWLDGLIVPLWNWNLTTANDIWYVFRFNRTFMELK